MKKIFAKVFTAAAVCAVAVIGAAGCGNAKSGYAVYAPDGAPALALVNAISQADDTFNYHVIDSTTIQARIGGKSPVADFCVLPVNLAATLLGTGETYQMLGTVTNGNLFFLSTGNIKLTSENLKSELIGKTIGVMQLTNVPGLTLKAVLDKYDIAYEIIEELSASVDSEAVALYDLGTDAGSVTPAVKCDYFLCPEPAATTKVANVEAFNFAGDLQELYGGEDGYPQAVLIAKSSVIQNDASAVNTFISYMEGSAEYLKTVTPDAVLNLLENVREHGLTPSFNANNLTSGVINNCSVWYTPAKDCKAVVNEFLAKIGVAVPSDNFFYVG